MTEKSSLTEKDLLEALEVARKAARDNHQIAILLKQEILKLVRDRDLLRVERDNLYEDLQKAKRVIKEAKLFAHSLKIDPSEQTLVRRLFYSLRKWERKT